MRPSTVSGALIISSDLLRIARAAKGVARSNQPPRPASPASGHRRRYNCAGRRAAIKQQIARAGRRRPAGTVMGRPGRGRQAQAPTLPCPHPVIIRPPSASGRPGARPCAARRSRPDRLFRRPPSAASGRPSPGERVSRLPARVRARLPRQPACGRARGSWREPSAAPHRPVPPSGSRWAAPSAADTRPASGCSCVARCRLSVFSFLPSSRQTMNSGVTDFLTGTAGTRAATGCLHLDRADRAQGIEHAADQRREVAHPQLVAAGMRRHDLRGQTQQFCMEVVVVHFIP